MKKTLAALLFGAGWLTLSAGASAATGVSINIGEPGFYGRIDIGDAPPPRVVYAEPVIIERAPRYMEQAPVYLRVPVSYQRDWRRHCGAYRACGQRVFFVQDNWYRNEYAPHYRQHHGRPHDRRDDPHYRPGPPPREMHGHDDRHGGPGGRGPGPDHGRDQGRDHGRDDRHGGPDGRPGNERRD